ncbi:glycosyltransferase family 2 protein [Pseudalkalibacillus sp. SCS-8]|uniref:glycosyltransferase family 2 protein n=1 Tax=Pseudalkalibacillus nanhaiensis TaxID=3115291 RepID=UPI0032DA7DB4
MSTVSIVVPIYNVERYLSRCLESIKNQSYKNLEIILVVDGATDGSLKIAKGYENQDSRIKVFQKENGGLSDARNYGMGKVTGRYTMFVDSDDWLEMNIVERLKETLEEHEAQVVQSAFYYTYDHYMLVDERERKIGSPPVKLNNLQLMNELIRNKLVKNFVWAKLYQTELIKNIPFKKGVIFEDMYWSYKVMKEVQQYVIINEPLYHYYQRSSSISGTYSPRSMDLIYGMKERHTFLKEQYPDLVYESSRHILMEYLNQYQRLFLHSHGYRKTKKHRDEVQKHIENHRDYYLDLLNEEKDMILMLRMFLIHPLLYMTLMVVKKLLSRLRILQKDEPLTIVKQDAS